MAVISASVGEGGVNRGADVKLVESLLNRVLDKIYPDKVGLQPDGSISIMSLHVNESLERGTIKAIRDFQKRVCNFKWPDGRIDPGGRTIRKLLSLFAELGGVIRLDLRQADKLIVPGSTFRRGGAMYQSGIYRAGDLTAGLDGSRLILSISPRDTIFMLLDNRGPGKEMAELNPMRGIPGTVYIQKTAAFMDERDGMFHHDLYQRLKPLQTLIEVHANIMLAVVASTSGVGLVVVLGTDAVQFYVNNRQKFSTWVRAFSVVVEVRTTLKMLAPSLYDKMVDALLHGIKRGTLAAIGFTGDDVIGNIPDAMVKDPKTIGRLIGALIGNLGKATLTKRLTLIGAMSNVLLTLAKKAVAAVPGAIGITAADKARTAQELIDHFRKTGVPILEEEARKIVDEVEQRGKEIQKSLEDLADAMSAVRE